MAKVPAVDRSKLVLDFLAGNPQRSYRAAEVSKQLEMHRASCFTLLNALADAGLVTRDPDGPRYSLGPLLIRYGAKSARAYEGFAEARREMFRLADAVGYGCMLSGRLGHDVLTLDSVAVDEAGFPGGRSPLRAPRGTIFLAWSPADELEEWLEWSGVSASEEQRRAFVRAAAAIRARGYSLGADIELGMSLERIAHQLASTEGPDSLEQAMYQLANLLRRSGRSVADSGSFEESVHFITAPIFNRMGVPTLTFTLVAGAAPFPKPDVKGLAQRVVESADQASKAINA